MKIRDILSVIPRRLRPAAPLVGVSLLLAGWVAAGWAWTQGVGLQAALLYALAALVLGVVSTVWIGAVGYVFGDARQRGMRAGLWAVVVSVFPHLLGFLLYFVIRQPVAARCMHCGCNLAPPQHFCPACGSPSAADAPAHLERSI